MILTRAEFNGDMLEANVFAKTKGENIKVTTHSPYLANLGFFRIEDEILLWHKTR